MNFDRTHGKPARYIVTAYAWNVVDHYYYNTYREAKACFKRLKSMDWGKDTILSVSNMDTDVRKDFYRF